MAQSKLLKSTQSEYLETCPKKNGYHRLIHKGLPIICLVFLNLLHLSARAQRSLDSLRTDGLRLGLNAAALFYPILTGNKPQLEIQVDYGFGKRFLAFEMGLGSYAQSHPKYNFESQGGWFSIGYEENSQKIGDDMVYLGIRYGQSFANQNYSNIKVLNPEGDGLIQVADNVKSIHTIHFFEPLAGFKVKIWSNFYLGIAARLRVLLGGLPQKDGFTPLWMPGYGQTDRRSNAQLTYTVSYKIPFNSYKTLPPPK